MIRKIAVVTATRAEYGILMPLIRKIDEHTALDLDLIVTGMHLSRKYGYTINEIYCDGFFISHEIPILDEDNSPYGISVTMSNAIEGFAKCFRDDRPDMVVILGDRTEMLGVASAAMNERIPIAHIHGGEVTQGAVDDCVRHAITKMSYLHFAATDVYRRRIIQLGENPERVFHVGSLGAENILTQKLYSKEQLIEKTSELSEVGKRKYVVVTYHPVTLEGNCVEDQICELGSVMSERNDLFYLITASNADVGGHRANEMLQDFAGKNKNTAFVYNLGMKRYLSAVKYASFVMGNSSSGILEAPVIGTPAVNIGDRQKGMLITDIVMNCKPQKEDILRAISYAERLPHKPTSIYGDGHTSNKIVEIILSTLNQGINLKKSFYDLGVKNV